MQTGLFAMASLSLMTMSIAASSAAQTVAGRVLDRQSKRPLPDITVVLVGDSGKSLHASMRATTDSSGTFYLHAPAAGVYELLFTTASDTLATGYLALQQGEVAQREFLLDTHVAERAYFQFQVTRPVRLSPKNPPPISPEALWDAKIQGEVLLQFIVDSTGKLDMNTIKV